jgi:hypothetical protein
MRNAKLEHTLNYGAAQTDTAILGLESGILELESRCAVIRTVGSNATPSAIF